MPIGIFDLAHSVRKNSAAQGPAMPLGHSQQLVVAALGYKTLAAYQAAQATSQEPAHLTDVHHVVLDVDRLAQRASELDVALLPHQLLALLNTAFRERAPHIRLPASYPAFEDFLRQEVDQTVTDDSNVNSEMANANYDGIDEVYFGFELPFDDIVVGSALEIELAGHVGLGIDTDRPYAGHIVNVAGVLRVPRLGQHCFGSVDCQVIRAELDTDWGDDDQEDGPPMRSTAQAYAELLGLDLHEVGDLVYVEAEPRDGNSGEMIYSYLLDFTDAASPEIAQKIRRRHGSLRIEVEPNFFDNVRSDDWPR